MQYPKVITQVVQNDLCTGCGLCVYQCPSKALSMDWNKYGFLIPSLSGNCDTTGDCISVCPFNPSPKKEVETETELAQLSLQQNQLHHEKIGKYSGLYAGHSIKHRVSSSSGGIATYIFEELLKREIVNHVFAVKESNTPGVHYEYKICSNLDEISKASKTKYFPVTLATVMDKVKELEGKVAIAGIACFIKAIRLAQYKDPRLKEKIPFLIGIICGGVKSRFFTEYLASKAGIENKNIKNPQFRIKDPNSTAIDYSYGCYDQSTQQQKTIKMRTVGDMWGTGLFKANACDFCDDVTTELADISLGDAWLPPYNQDGSGTNIIITRSLLAQQLIMDGETNGELGIDKLTLKQVLESQQGSYNHRHLGLAFRIKKQSSPIPPKRFDSEEITLDFKFVQLLRKKVRSQSLEVWRTSPNAKDFDIKMATSLNRLKRATKIYHYRKAIIRRIERILKNTPK